MPNSLPNAVRAALTSLAVLTASAVPLPSHAGDTDDSNDIDCEDPQTQLARNHCAKRTYEKAGQELKEVYSTLQDELEGESREMLETGQKRWTEYRAAHCKAVAQPHKGGSMHALRKFDCRERLTDQRTETLQTHYRRQLHRAGE